MRKPVVVFIAVLVVAGLVAYLGSPYWTLHQMRGAAAAGEGNRVASYVDFPALRDSIKVQLAQVLSRRLESRSREAPSPLGQALAGQMVNGLVDAMVTPDSVAMMIRSGNTPRAIAVATPPASAAGGADRKQPNVRHGFEGLNTFRATFVDPDTEKELLTAVLTRDGVFGWRLTGVRFPG